VAGQRRRHGRGHAEPADPERRPTAPPPPREGGDTEHAEGQGHVGNAGNLTHHAAYPHRLDEFAVRDHAGLPAETREVAVGLASPDEHDAPPGHLPGAAVGPVDERLLEGHEVQ
jgi:hypothetical protein